MVKKKLNINFTLDNSLFGSVKLTKNADSNKCKYGGTGIGFDSFLEFLLKVGSMGRNVIIFGADMSLSVKNDNKEKDDSIYLGIFDYGRVFEALNFGRNIIKVIRI